jgi:hypothetical protein
MNIALDQRPVHPAPGGSRLQPVLRGRLPGFRFRHALSRPGIFLRRNLKKPAGRNTFNTIQ